MSTNRILDRVKTTDFWQIYFSLAVRLRPDPPDFYLLFLKDTSSRGKCVFAHHKQLQDLYQNTNVRDCLSNRRGKTKYWLMRPYGFQKVWSSCCYRALSLSYISKRFLNTVFFRRSPVEFATQTSCSTVHNNLGNKDFQCFCSTLRLNSWQTILEYSTQWFGCLTDSLHKIKVTLSRLSRCHVIHEHFYSTFLPVTLWFCLSC